MTATLTRFASWPDVLAHVAAGLPVLYQAPLDHWPRSVVATVRGLRPTKVRVNPLCRDADAFFADAGHLDRFYVRSVVR